MGSLPFQNEKPRRGLEMVSHFFLSKPSPSKKETTVSDCFDDDEFLISCPKEAASALKQNQTSAVPDRPSNLYTIFSPEGFASQGLFLGCTMALSLAEQGVSVGLIETTARLPHTFYLSGGVKNVNAFFWNTDIGTPAFWRMVGRIQRACDFVMLNVASSILARTGEGRIPPGKSLVPTSARLKDLLYACDVIREIIHRGGEERASVIVFQTQPTDYTPGAKMELEKMLPPCFLPSIRFLGPVPITEAFMASDAYPSLTSLKQVPHGVVEVMREMTLDLVGLRESG